MLQLAALAVGVIDKISGQQVLHTLYGLQRLYACQQLSRCKSVHLPTLLPRGTTIIQTAVCHASEADIKCREAQSLEASPIHHKAAQQTTQSNT